MNLLYEQFTKDKFRELYTLDKITFANFREYEYRYKLKDIIESMLKYLQENTTDEFKFEYEYSIEDTKTSVFYDYTEAIQLTVEYSYEYKTNSVEDKLQVKIPKLMDRHFFYIHDNKYIPVIRLKDRTLHFGPEKIVLGTIQAPISIKFRTEKGKYDPNECVVRVYTKRKVGFHEFIYQLFKDYDDDFLIKLSAHMNYDFTKKPKNFKKNIKDFIGHLIIFNTNPNDDWDLNNIMTNLVFNDFTRRQINFELGFEVKDFRELIKFIFTNFIFEEDYSFSYLHNLQNRRFLFLEDILKPLTFDIYKFLTSVSSSLKNIKLTMNKEKIISTFMVGDPSTFKGGGKYLYDYGSVNTGVKANIAIQMDGEVKKFMRSLDPSFKNIICPISTSSSEPGVTIHVNPETELSYFGHIMPRFKTLLEGINERDNQ